MSKVAMVEILQLQQDLQADPSRIEDAEYDKTAQQLVQRLGNGLPKDIDPDEIISSLSSSSQTILFLHVLNALIDIQLPNLKSIPRQLPVALLPDGSLWPHIAAVLLNFDPIQARYAGDMLLTIVTIVGNGAEQTANPFPAIQLLHNVILRLDPSSSTLTSTHYTFLRLCVLARAYSDATHILDLPIYSIAGDFQRQSINQIQKYACSDHESSAVYLNSTTGLSARISSRMYLEYNLLAAMCYMALRNYLRAMFFLEAVLITPASSNAVSKIMLEAYKKWLLVGLLLDGEPPKPPTAISQPNLRVLRSLAKPYECVVDAFKSGQLTRLRGEIQEGQAWWAEDTNNALILEVFEAFRKFSILKLAKTFTALSIADVTRRTGSDPNNLDDTVQYVTGLIQRGELNASLSASQPNVIPILRFLASPTAQKSEAQVSQELAGKTAELQSLLKQVVENDHKLEVNKEYIEYLKKLKRGKEQEGKDGGKGNVMDIDEEIMGDF